MPSNRNRIPGGRTRQVRVHSDPSNETIPGTPHVAGHRKSEKQPVAAESTSTPVKEPWVPPEGTIVPDRGWPKFQYALYRFFSIKKVPAINAAQQAEIDHLERQKKLEQRRAYKQSLIRRLVYLASLGIQPIFCVAQVKSAGKSSTAIGLGTVISEYTRKMTIIIPSTANTATATVGRMAGISGNMLTIDEYLKNVKLYGTFRTLEQKLPRTKWGLGVIVESNNASADDADDANITPFMEAIDTSLPNVSALVLDLGNDNISRRSIALQAARLAHVLVLPFMVGSAITTDSLKDTISFYNTDKQIPEDVWNEFYEHFENKSFTGLNITTREKVRNSILVATKAEGEVDFDHYARTRAQGAEADDLQPWGGTGICVPNEPSIGRQDANNMLLPYDYDAVSLDYDISMLQLAVAGYEIVGHKTNVNIGTPMVANIPELTPKQTDVTEAPVLTTEQEGGASS